MCPTPCLSYFSNRNIMSSLSNIYKVHITGLKNPSVAVCSGMPGVLNYAFVLQFSLSLSLGTSLNWLWDSVGMASPSFSTLHFEIACCMAMKDCLRRRPVNQPPYPLDIIDSYVPGPRSTVVVLTKLCLNSSSSGERV